MKPERRYLATEFRQDAQGRLEGYAAVFNQMSEDLGGFRESIVPGAFAATIAADDVRGLWNHDPNFVLGRNRANTLELSEDSTGLLYRITPPDTQWARDLMVSISRGDVNQSSFGFQTLKDEWQGSENGRTRSLIEVKLFDVSPVTFPAYPQTAVGVRSLVEQLRGFVGNDPALIQQTLDELRQTFGSVDIANDGARVRDFMRRKLLLMERI